MKELKKKYKLKATRVLADNTSLSLLRQTQNPVLKYLYGTEYSVTIKYFRIPVIKCDCSQNIRISEEKISK
jgi:hypothetical protein